MGGKKGNKSKKSKTKTAVQKAAEARHAKFKQTKVQTFGGKRTKFSKSEESRIKKAGYGVDGYSKAAPNKASGYSGTSGVSVGSKIKNPNPKVSGVGPVISGSEYADMLKASPPRFNELGRNEVNQDLAFINFNKIKESPANTPLGDGMIKDSLNQMQKNLKQKYDTMRDSGIMSDQEYNKQMKRLLGDQFKDQSSLNTGTLTATHDNRLFKSVPATGPAGDQPASDFYKKGILQKNILPGTLRNPLGIPLASTAPISTLGIQTAASGSEVGFDRDSFNRALEGNYDPDSAGGLNIGGGEGSGSRSRVLTSEQLGDAYKSTLNPDSFKGLSDGETFGSGPVASGEDYARGLNVSPYGSVENTMRSVVGKIPLVNRIPGVNTRLLTDKEIADKRISAQNQLAYRKEMAKFRGGASGGNRLPVTPTVIEEILPEALPVPSASTTPTTQTGVDPNRLLQIQQQAYAQAYNPMLIGGFNPQFRFGAATPTIDYSTYFNY